MVVIYKQTTGVNPLLFQLSTFNLKKHEHNIRNNRKITCSIN